MQKLEVAKQKIAEACISINPCDIRDSFDGDGTYEYRVIELFVDYVLKTEAQCVPIWSKQEKYEMGEESLINPVLNSRAEINSLGTQIWDMREELEKSGQKELDELRSQGIEGTPQFVVTALVELYFSSHVPQPDHEWLENLPI